MTAPVSTSLRAMNETRAVMLSENVKVADTFLARGRGLLGTDDPGGGLLLRPCGSVHTWFMRYPIDVIFLDGSGVVLRALGSLPPWRMAPSVRGAKAVLELRAGTVKATGTAPGDTIRLHPPN